MFSKARLKLTGWYLIIIMLISTVFSVAIYRVLTNELNRFATIQRYRIERRLRQGDFFPQDPNLHAPQLTVPIMDPELVEETRRRIAITLILINGGILVISGALGFVLAGRTLQPIKNMLDEQNRFVSDASHELRTPLTSLKSAFEVFLRNKRPTILEAKKIVGESIDEVNKLQALSESLLKLTQYQPSNGHLSFKELQLSHVITQAVHQIEPIASRKKITVKTNLVDQTIEGNSESLINLMVILLDNAIKYSHPNSTVQVMTKKSDGNMLITVEDHGIGIEADDIDHIFDRFFRADSARSKTATGGYGLGLSIAKKIIETHKGAISVQSTLGKGSIFTIRLPIKHTVSATFQL